MKYALAKLLHVFMFIAFGGASAWGAFVFASYGTGEGKVFAALLLGLAACGAKWCFVDGFAAVDRKQALDASTSI